MNEQELKQSGQRLLFFRSKKSKSFPGPSSKIGLKGGSLYILVGAPGNQPNRTFARVLSPPHWLAPINLIISSYCEKRGEKK